MRILGCIRPQQEPMIKDEVSPAEIKTKDQSFKIAAPFKEPKPSILNRIFSSKKTDEKQRLTSN